VRSAVRARAPGAQPADVKGFKTTVLLENAAFTGVNRSFGTLQAMLLAQRAEALAEARDEIRAQIEGALAGGLDPVFLVEEDYRLALLDAESSFVARFIEQIDQPEAEFGQTWRTFHKEKKT
jgi:hypothetical protein